ncbi:MAG: deaminase [Endozoicomonadaceae bacterium]|nr:deaminase [Endozoicomonadaceae bacterium]
MGHDSNLNSDMIYLRMARELAAFSKCVSLHVACLLVKDGRILSTGVNGTPAGWTNCSEQFPQGKSSAHSLWSNAHEIHAELNAVIWAARTGIAIENATAYVTHSPCVQCTKNLIAAGVKRIVYAERYDRTEDQQALTQFVRENGIDIQQIPL